MILPAYVFAQTSRWRRDGQPQSVKGFPMADTESEYGNLGSNRPEAAEQDCVYLDTFLGRRGVFDLQWQRPGDNVDRNLREVFLPTLEVTRQLHRTFLDTGLGFSQRGYGPAPHDGDDPVLREVFVADLAYLKEHYLSHPQAFHWPGPDGKPWPAICWWGVGVVIRNPEWMLEHCAKERVLVFADVFGAMGEFPPVLKRLGHWATGFTLAIPGAIGEIPYQKAVDELLGEMGWWDEFMDGRMSPATSIEFSNESHIRALTQARAAGHEVPPIPSLVKIRLDEDPEVAYQQARRHLVAIRDLAAGRPVAIQTGDNDPERTRWWPEAGPNGRWKAELVNEVFVGPRGRYDGPKLRRVERKSHSVIVGRHCDVLGEASIALRDRQERVFKPEVRPGGRLRWHVSLGTKLTVRNLDGKEATV